MPVTEPPPHVVDDDVEVELLEPAAKALENLAAVSERLPPRRLRVRSCDGKPACPLSRGVNGWGGGRLRSDGLCGTMDLRLPGNGSGLAKSAPKFAVLAGLGASLARKLYSGDFLSCA